MNKSQLHDALITHLPNGFQAEIPAMIVPVSPTDVGSAIIASANCQREYLRFLNTFAGMKVGDFFLYSGNGNSILECLLHTSIRHKPNPGNIQEPVDCVQIEGAEELNASFLSILSVHSSEIVEPIVPQMVELFPDLEDVFDLLTGLEDKCIEYMKASPILQSVGKLLYSSLINWMIRYLFGVALPIPFLDQQESEADIASLEQLTRIADELEQINDEEALLQIGDNGYYLKSKVVIS